jgi:hypothetical protein
MQATYAGNYSGVADAIRARIDQFAAHNSTTPRSLNANARRDLIRELKKGGFLEAFLARSEVPLQIALEYANGASTGQTILHQGAHFRRHPPEIASVRPLPYIVHFKR